MNKTTSSLLAAAVTGMLMGGTLTSCAGGPDSNTSAQTEIEKHACKGMNSCKGNGGCATSKHACKGMNDCKGLGGCAVEGKNSCKGQNECKGHGGCKVGN